MKRKEPDIKQEHHDIGKCFRSAPPQGPHQRAQHEVGQPTYPIVMYPAAASFKECEDLSEEILEHIFDEDEDGSNIDGRKAKPTDDQQALGSIAVASIQIHHQQQQQQQHRQQHHRAQQYGCIQQQPEPHFAYSHPQSSQPPLHHHPTISFSYLPTSSVGLIQPSQNDHCQHRHQQSIKKRESVGRGGQRPAFWGINPAPLYLVRPIGKDGHT